VYREHNGGVNGGLTVFAYLPEAGLGHAIMINSGSGAAYREISDLVRTYETRNMPQTTFTKEMEVNDQHRQIEGLYQPINPRQNVAYFIERVFGVRKLWFENDTLVMKDLLGGEPAYFFPVTTGGYKSQKTGLVSLVQVRDPLAEEVVHAGSSVIKPVGSLMVFGTLAVVALWCVLMASSLLFFPVWIVRKLRGKIQPGATIRVRLWPLLVSVSVVAFAGLITVGFADPFKLLGKPSAVSIGIMLLSAVFAVFSVLGIYSCVVARNTPMNRVVYWHSAVSSLVHTMVVVYLLSFGIIGVRVWA